MERPPFVSGFPNIPVSASTADKFIRTSDLQWAFAATLEAHRLHLIRRLHPPRVEVFGIVAHGFQYPRPCVTAKSISFSVSSQVGFSGS